MNITCTFFYDLIEGELHIVSKFDFNALTNKD